MSGSNWQQTLYNANADGPALANTTTATSILNGIDKRILSPDQMKLNTALAFKIGGQVSNIVTTPGTLTLSVRTVGGVILMTSQAIALNAVAKVNVTWWAEFQATLRQIGSGTGASFMWQGVFSSESVVGAAAGTMVSVAMPASAPALGAGFDSSANQQIDVFATWSIANAGNSIQMKQYLVEHLN